jgi:hypothetical protein
MAFNFLGTIESLEQFAEFEDFVNIEVLTISKRIDHLSSEIANLDELLGKFKIADTRLRTEFKKSEIPDLDWIVLARSREVVKLGALDGDTAVDVDSLKLGFLDAIKHKRERNEFKIKRIRDLQEQMSDEIKMLQTRQDDWKDIISKIKSKFQIKDYTEIQTIADVDEIDYNPALRAVPIGGGTEVVNGITYYLVQNINAATNAITFYVASPSVKIGDTLTLTNGKNDGVKTVTGNQGGRTLIVLETLVDESPATSKVTI